MLGAPLICPCKEDNCITGIAMPTAMTFGENHPVIKIRPWPNPMARLILPAVFTQVSAKKDWIQSQLKIKDQEGEAIFIRKSGAVRVWKQMPVTWILMFILLFHYSF